MKNKAVYFVLFVLLSSFSFAQTGTRLVDFNAKSVGRGGTSIGYFDNGSLMMTNPAGLSFLKGSMIDANFSVMLPSLHFKNNINDTDGDNNIFPLPALSYVHSNAGKLVWGVGFFTAGGMGADFKLQHSLFRDQNGAYLPQEYHSQLASMQGGLSVAYKLAENLSVGASAHLVYSQLEFWMPYSLNPMAMQGVAMPGMTFGQMFSAPASMGGFGYNEVTAYAKMSGLTALGFNGKIGLAYKTAEGVTVGFSYTMPTALTYKNGTAGMDMTAQMNDAFGKAVTGYMMMNPTSTPQQAQAAIMGQFAQLGIDLTKGAVADYNLDLDLTFPQSVGIGFAYNTADNFNVSMDFEWINWENAFDKMTMHLTGGSNPNINKMMGNDGNFDMDFPLNWKNSILIKLGIEYFINPAFTLRAGGAYSNNPVPPSTIFPVFPAIVESHLMLGASYRISDPLTVNAACEVGFKNTQQAALASLIAREYDNSKSSLSTMLFHVSFNYGL